MREQCATPWCRTPSHGRSQYCSRCIKLRRRAYQRARRGDANPAGPLPAAQVRALVAELDGIRDSVDYSNRRRWAIEARNEDPNNLFAVYDGLSLEVSAHLMGVHAILEEWNDRNNITAGNEPD